jgi:hypothetical protein
MWRAWQNRVAIVLLGVLSLSVSAVVAAAQGDEPPAVGATVYEHALTDGAPTPFTCPTGRASTEQTEGGYLLRVGGRCESSAASASVGPTIEGVQVADGEVRVEGLAQQGSDRAQIGIAYRRQVSVASLDGGDDGYYALAWPARGLVSLTRLRGRQATVLVQRTDLGPLMHPGDWNSLAIRTQGPNLWVFINDQLAVTAVDDTYARGSVGIFARRAGNLDDSGEIAVLTRNVRVSALVEGDPARVPVVAAP